LNVLARGDRLQHIRLASGLVLFAFVSTHLLNHALGIVGIDAMEEFQTLRFQITRTWIGSGILGAAFLFHIVMALYRTAQRRVWQMPAWEIVQIASGLAIPLLLIDHVMTTRGSHVWYGSHDFYRPVLLHYWPSRAAPQLLLLLVAWTHACIGLHYWLRLAPWYGRVAPFLLSAAVLLPAFALAGFFVAARSLSASLTPEALAELRRAAAWPVDRTGLEQAAFYGIVIYLSLLALVGAVHAMRRGIGSGRRQIPVRYTAGPEIKGPAGATLLEMSRMRGVPHASMCGGRARCSTCRVRVEEGAHALALPEFAEAVTLGAVAAPPQVRLACQIRPQHPIAVTRLVSPSMRRGSRRLSLLHDAQGVEKTVAIMFLDVRGFTRMSDHRLPYDVVFLLNRFFGAIGEAIASEGGWIDKYMGDGLLAVFGRDSGPEAGCRAALAAAAKIDRALETLNAEFEAEAHPSLRIGMGLHVGQLVIGRIGHPDTASVTVIGRAVNVASRLEALSKEKSCQLVVSRELARMADWTPPRGVPAERVTVRGSSEAVEVLLIARAAELLQGAPVRQ